MRSYAAAGVIALLAMMWVAGSNFLASSCVNAASPFGVLIGQLKMAVAADYCPHGSYGISSLGNTIFALLGTALLLLTFMAGTLGAYAWIWASVGRTILGIVAAFGRWKVPHGRIHELVTTKGVRNDEHQHTPNLRMTFRPFLWRAPPLAI